MALEIEGIVDGGVCCNEVLTGLAKTYPAAAGAATSDLLVSRVAGLVPGAMVMAAGQYVSISSQSDTEQAYLARERAELAGQPEFEHEELTHIYIDRGANA